MRIIQQLCLDIAIKHESTHNHQNKHKNTPTMAVKQQLIIAAAADMIITYATHMSHNPSNSLEGKSQ